MKFNKSYRLLQASDYDHVFAQPIKFNSSLATIYARSNTLPHARLGLLVSKRALKRAVDRNRIKRLVRESFRLTQVSLKAYDIIFVARSSLQAADNKAVFSQLADFWKELG